MELKNDVSCLESQTAPALATLQDVDTYIRSNLQDAAKLVIAVGYGLKQIRDRELYREEGFESVFEYARAKYGFSNSNTTRYIQRNEKFSKGGNSPEIDDRYAQYSKSQLQEMLSLDAEQLELVSPDMTAREIRDLRKTKEIPYFDIPGQGEMEDIPGVVPEAAGETVLSASDFGTGQMDAPEQGQSGITSFSVDDFTEPAEETAVATSQKPADGADNKNYDGCPDGISCCPRNEWGTTPEEQEAGRKECRKCWEQYETRQSILDGSLRQRYDAEDKRMEEENEEKQEQENPLRWNTENEYETRRKYCNAAARKFINSFHDWMLKDYENRVLNVTQSEKEFKQEFRKSGNCSWHFMDPEDETKVAKVNLFDNYIQFWNGEGTCIGNCRWFYLCASVQNMWNVISLEAAEKEKEELQSGPAEEEVIDAEFTEPEEETLSDFDLLKDILKSKKNLLDSCLRIDGLEESSVHIRKMKLEVAALASMLCDLDNMQDVQEEEEQQELPILKNNEKRGAFIDSYESWPIWIDRKETGERYYRYRLPEADIVIKVYFHRCFDFNSTAKEWKDRYHDGWGAAEYYLMQEGQHFKDCKTNKSALVEYLKELQKCKN